MVYSAINISHAEHANRRMLPMPEHSKKTPGKSQDYYRLARMVRSRLARLARNSCEN